MTSDPPNKTKQMTEKTKQKKNPIVITPKGIAKYPHLITPDAKFNKQDPKFHTKLVFKADDPKFIEFREKCEAQITEAVERYKQENPKYAKRLTTKYSLFREVFDDAGDPTGEVEIKVTAKAEIRNPQTGKVSKMKLEFFDSKGVQFTPSAIYGGSTLRLSIRVGITGQGNEITEYAHLFGVQVIKLASGSGGVRFGADEDEDGFDASEQDDGDDEGFESEDSDDAEGEEAADDDKDF